jgi:integrase
MPRQAKGPRLYLREGRIEPSTGKRREPIWVIRDGSREVSTGLTRGELDAAQQRLAQYIAEKWAPVAGGDPSDPKNVLIAEVLALYAREKAPTLADPKSIKGWIQNLATWWGDKTVADVKGKTCREYVAWRTSQRIASGKGLSLRMVSHQTARRELETLSGAIGHWHKEHTLTTRPVVVLPDKPESPRDALTRSEAARLLLSAKGRKIGSDGCWQATTKQVKAQRLHLRRFLLIGLYTGTRAKVITSLLWSETPKQAWVDLDKGMIYRRGREERDKATKRRPVVRIPSRLLAHMRRWREMDRRKEVELRRENPEMRINSVLHYGGQPIATDVRNGFASMVADAGLSGAVTPHWLRHTAATWLMEGGADVWDASAYLGMTAATLEKHYGHHRPDHQAAARRAISRQSGAVSGA